MPLFESKPEPAGREDLEDMDTEEVLKGARRYEAELQKRRAAFESTHRVGRIESLDLYHRIERFLDGAGGDER